MRKTPSSSAKPRRASRGLHVAVGLLLGTVAAAAMAQAGYPNRPVRVVVPYPPGGNTDVIAREVMREVSTRMGQPFVIDNKPGANGAIGTDMVAKAAPDGYTLGVVIGAYALSPSLYRNLPYQATDFVPVTQMSRTSLVLVASQQAPYKDVAALARAGKAQGPLSFASSGLGSAAHLLSTRFARATDITTTHVPYKGSTDAVNDLVAGRVGFMFDAVSAMGGLISQGRLQALAVTSANRSTLLPNVPSIAELGYPQLVSYAWSGVLAPAQTPRPVVERLSAEIAAALRAPAVRERLAAISTEAVGSSPAEFEAFIREETRVGAEAIRQAGITPE